MSNLSHWTCPVISAHEHHVTTIASRERMPGYAPLHSFTDSKRARIIWVSFIKSVYCMMIGIAHAKLN